MPFSNPIHARRWPPCSPGGNTLQKAAHLPVPRSSASFGDDTAPPPRLDKGRWVWRRRQVAPTGSFEGSQASHMLPGVTPLISHTSLLFWKEEKDSERARACPRSHSSGGQGGTSPPPLPSATEMHRVPTRSRESERELVVEKSPGHCECLNGGGQVSLPIPPAAAAAPEPAGSRKHCCLSPRLLGPLSPLPLRARLHPSSCPLTEQRERNK